MRGDDTRREPAADLPDRALWQHSRMADASEVSNLVVFLASDESAFITGTEHVIDGGMTAL